jgi:hypothetical protein
MARITGYLVIRNGDDPRWVKRRPHLEPNEVAIAVNITAPVPPRIVATIDIELPEPPPISAEAIVTEYVADNEAIG